MPTLFRNQRRQLIDDRNGICKRRRRPFAGDGHFLGFGFGFGFGSIVHRRRQRDFVGRGDCIDRRDRAGIPFLDFRGRCVTVADIFRRRRRIRGSASDAEATSASAASSGTASAIGTATNAMTSATSVPADAGTTMGAASDITRCDIRRFGTGMFRRAIRRRFSDRLGHFIDGQRSGRFGVPGHVVLPRHGRCGFGKEVVQRRPGSGSGIESRIFVHRNLCGRRGLHLFRGDGLIGRPHTHGHILRCRHILPRSRSILRQLAGQRIVRMLRGDRGVSGAPAPVRGLHRNIAVRRRPDRRNSLARGSIAMGELVRTWLMRRRRQAIDETRNVVDIAECLGSDHRVDVDGLGYGGRCNGLRRVFFLVPIMQRHDRWPLRRRQRIDQRLQTVANAANAGMRGASPRKASRQVEIAAATSASADTPSPEGIWPAASKRWT
jgi:hypothetical protein